MLVVIPSNTYQFTYLAAFCKNEEILDKLLRKGARVDYEDNNGDTPLHWVKILV